MFNSNFVVTEEGRIIEHFDCLLSISAIFIFNKCEAGWVLSYPDICQFSILAKFTLNLFFCNGGGDSSDKDAIATECHFF